MPNKDGYWTLGIQLNRKIRDKVYSSLRFYVPVNDDTKSLLKRLQLDGGEKSKLQYRAKIEGQGARIILTLTQPQYQTKASSPRLRIGELADHVIAIIAQEGGTATWPFVREKLGRPAESMPGPILVKALTDRGMKSTKDPKTSTMIWKLIDRERLNGWTSPRG
jgi:hypothetical protein